jgi:hypothetical protein
MKHIILSFLVPPFSAILTSSERLMIGKWISLPLSTLCRIPLD